MAENVLYYGDNLEILRRYIEDESVDLVHLDPPFNSGNDQLKTNTPCKLRRRR
jgi:DNA modification methylase